MTDLPFMPSDFNTTNPGILRKWRERLFQPVDIASLVYFRVIFGLLMVTELWRYVLDGSAYALWIRPTFHFKYPGFEWIPHPAGYGIYLLMAAAGIGAAGMVLGLFYRFSTALFTLCFAWLSLLDQSKYMNHFYLICLLGGMALFLPAHRKWSADVQRNPSTECETAPRWTIGAVQGLMVLVYFYGGVAKLNGDWLRGEPVRMWLEARSGPGQWGHWLHSEPMVYFVCYGGLLFDLSIGPLLLANRTRGVASILCIGFHLLNSQLFSIGVFPWLGIAMIGVFFPPHWPRKLLNCGVQNSQLGATGNPSGTLTWEWNRKSAVLFGLGLFFGIQILFPLRHWLYPGDVHWTEEGHMFSWHMMLRSKKGEARFWAKDQRSGQVWEINPLRMLTPRQYVKMIGRPEMLRQFASFAGRKEAELRQEQEGQRGSGERIAVHVVAPVQLNRDPAALLVDPEVDLSRVADSWGSRPWILARGNKVKVPAWIPLGGGLDVERLRNEVAPME